MTRQEFDEYFIKTSPEFSRYLYKIIQSRGVSQTRIKPYDIINNTYLNIINRKELYLKRDTTQVKSLILQDLKWKLIHEIRTNKEKFILLEPSNEEKDNLDEIIDNLTTHSEIDTAKIDIKPYLEFIRKHKDKVGAEYFIEWLTLDRGSLKQLALLTAKYGFTRDQERSIVNKFSFYLRNRVRIAKNRSDEPSKFRKKENYISEKQIELKERKQLVKKYLKEGKSVIEMAELIPNVTRTGLYHTIRKLKK